MSVINLFGPDNYSGFFFKKRKGVLFLPWRKKERKVTGTHRSNVACNTSRVPDERQISNIVLHRASRERVEPRGNKGLTALPEEELVPRMIRKIRTRTFPIYAS